jgi:thiamine biosynthesis lipoprotein
MNNKITLFIQSVCAAYIICSLLLVSGCREQHKTPPPIEHTWLTMGTFASITLHGDDKSLMPEYSATVKKCFSNINSTLSTYIPNSEISKINAASNTIAISGLTFDILETTLNYCRISGGAFDPTVKPLIKMWGFNGATVPTNLPSPQTIADTLKKTGYRHLKLKHNSSPPEYTLTSPIPIDLGGIAKGYAVDQAYNLLTNSPQHSTQTNAPGFLINLGGNIRCHGRSKPDRSWCIGVRNPFNRGELVGTLTMAGGTAVATSGNYERFVIIDGKRYAHIIDPRSGYPVQGMAGVTVLSSNATEADAMSTALYVAGTTDAPAILKKLPTCNAILIPDKNPIEIWISPGMKNFFTPYPEYSNNVRELIPETLTAKKKLNEIQ